jgi:hypothetical protein
MADTHKHCWQEATTASRTASCMCLSLPRTDSWHLVAALQAHTLKLACCMAAAAERLPGRCWDCMAAARDLRMPAKWQQAHKTTLSAQQAVAC